MSQAYWFLGFAVLCLCLVLRIVLFCEIWVVFSLSFTLASGFVCFWPSVFCACVVCAVCAASATLSSWDCFCCDCLSCTCCGIAGWLVSLLCPPSQLLFVDLPWGLFCGIQSPWPLVAPYPYVLPRLGFFLWCLSRLGFEVLRSCFPDLPFFWGGALFPLPLLFYLGYYNIVRFCPGNSGFLDFLAVGFFLSTSSVSLVVESRLRLMFQFCPLFFGCAIVRTVFVSSFIWLQPSKLLCDALC